MLSPCLPSGALRTRRAQRALCAGLLILASGLTSGCDGPIRVVTERSADQAFRSNASNHSTDAYPRRELGAETRVACGGNPRAKINRRILFSTKANLGPEARIEFGFGAESSEAGQARILVTATSQDGEQDGKAAEQIVFEAVFGTPELPAGRWHDVSISVNELSGSSGATKFTFLLEPVLAPGLPIAQSKTSVVLSCPVFTETQVRASRPNLILVSLDTLRADRLPLYGYARDTAPNLTKLFREEGVVVERTFSQGTDTLRGHTAMLFGLNPSIVRDESFHSWGLPHRLPTIADLMRAEGYRTAAFTENAFVAAGFRFANGFERYQETRTTASPLGPTGEVKETLARGLAWAEQHREEPFFLFLHTYQVHAPYDPPKPYAETFARQTSKTAWERESDHYDAEIAYTDHEFANFYERLATLNLADNTILIVTSDHGEEFAEHGGREHGATLHNEVLHVPLLLRAPGLLPAGVRRAGPMSLVDLLPTLVDLLALPVASWSSGDSRAAHLRDGEPIKGHRSWAEAWALHAGTYGGVDPTWKRPGYALTEWPYRLLRLRQGDGHRYELFHLEDDPLETTDIFSETLARTPAIDSMLKALDAYPNQVLVQRQALRDLVQSQNNPAPRPNKAPVPEAVSEKLRTLGYID